MKRPKLTAKPVTEQERLLRDLPDVAVLAADVLDAAESDEVPERIRRLAAELQAGVDSRRRPH